MQDRTCWIVEVKIIDRLRRKSIVRDIERDRDDVARQCLAHETGDQKNADGKNDRERQRRVGQKPPRTPAPEAPEVYAAARLGFGEQHAADQEPGDHEEDIDADKSAGESGHLGVIKDDGEN